MTCYEEAKSTTESQSRDDVDSALAHACRNRKHTPIYNSDAPDLKEKITPSKSPESTVNAENCSSRLRADNGENATGVAQENQQMSLHEETLNDLKESDTNGESRRVGSKLIGIDGNWYDITNFIRHHPGGDVIEHFIGRDASALVHVFHDKDVLKHRRPVGTYKLETGDPASEVFENLHKYFLNNGFFQTSLKWYVAKITFAFSLLAIAAFLVVACEQWYLHYIGAVFLASFWQQCGFFMHDFMHSQGTHERKIDTWLGIFFATGCFGVSGRWWRDDHFLHHALTNTVDYETDFSDPQCREAIWAQNEKLFPFYKHYIEYLAIKIQHLTFLPVCLVVGRIGIMIDSFKQEKRLPEWFALVFHWMYVVFLLSFLPTWQEIVIFYAIASILQGVLHVQLLVSHYSKPFFYEKDICNEQNWYRMQILCNINIVNPVWLDWFHGGLNFHIEHHLYPTMPRHKYREASKHVRKVCKELGLAYDECTWTEAVIRTLKHLKTTARHFKLDPR